MKQLAALRRAQRELGSERVIAALERAFEAWRAPNSLWRARLAREHGVYSPQLIELAVARGLAGWTGPALQRLHARELTAPHRPPGVTAVWLAGSIPTSAFAALALPLLGGSAVYAKPTSADPVSPRLFAESLRAVDAGVAAAVALGDDAAALEEADAVVAHGRDETLAAIRTRVPVDRPFLGYGHKLSLAAIGRGVDAEQAAHRLALDVALYDGRGCLSPVYLLVEDVPAGRAERLAEALARGLERLEAELPRGTLSEREHAWLHDVRAAFAVRDDATIHLSRGSNAWGVVASRFEGAPPFAGQLRTVPLIPVAGLDGLASWCTSVAPHLSCLGHAGFGGRTAELAPIVLASGGSRVCPLGRMQFPPIDWRHDGRDVLRPLVRLLDREGPEEAEGD